ncbi:hypothetical protein NHX12_005084 [Muraenolepis orangiensis]|uniref:Uncharacterized protein n=1 Tax=Muraenolepis orangiensis TaxID=630683 RepID=A0A9Q0IG53_9TELE|nr:hypothetical protein NHX12_005084 [Muraenolepis orangiensis]
MTLARVTDSPLSLFLFSFHPPSLPPPPPPPDDGVSIPSSYTSFLAPLSSSKLYNKVRGCRERDKDPECHFETFAELLPAGRAQGLLHLHAPHRR